MLERCYHQKCWRGNTKFHSISKLGWDFPHQMWAMSSTNQLWHYWKVEMHLFRELKTWHLLFSFLHSLLWDFYNSTFGIWSDTIDQGRRYIFYSLFFSIWNNPSDKILHSMQITIWTCGDKKDRKNNFYPSIRMSDRYGYLILIYMVW